MARRRKLRGIAAVSAVAAGSMMVPGNGIAIAAAGNGPTCAGGSVDGQPNATLAGALPGFKQGPTSPGAMPPTPMCFGTMFSTLPPFHYSDQAAADLAATMENPSPDPPGTDRGTADDSPTLASEYTYLGQFINHNLDFDETPQPTTNVNSSSLFLRALWNTPGNVLQTQFRPNPSLVKLSPETPKFSFGDLLVDTGLAPRSS